jgi:hypothetical protein
MYADGAQQRKATRPIIVLPPRESLTMSIMIAVTMRDPVSHLDQLIQSLLMSGAEAGNFAEESGLEAQFSAYELPDVSEPAEIPPNLEGVDEIPATCGTYADESNFPLSSFSAFRRTSRGNYYFCFP